MSWDPLADGCVDGCIPVCGAGVGSVGEAVEVDEDTAAALEELSAAAEAGSGGDASEWVLRSGETYFTFMTAAAARLAGCGLADAGAVLLCAARLTARAARAGVRLTPDSCCAVGAAALCVGCKVVSDDGFTNREIAAAAGVSVSDLSALERSLLCLLDFNVGPSDDDRPPTPAPRPRRRSRIWARLRQWARA